MHQSSTLLRHSIPEDVGIHTSALGVSLIIVRPLISLGHPSLRVCESGHMCL